MSYCAGVSASAARALGLAPQPPHVRCDGCGRVHGVERKDGMPYQWFLSRKGPPGWEQVPEGDTSRHYCKACRGKP